MLDSDESVACEDEVELLDDRRDDLCDFSESRRLLESEECRVDLRRLRFSKLEPRCLVFFSGVDDIDDDDVVLDPVDACFKFEVDTMKAGLFGNRGGDSISESATAPLRV